MRRAWTSFGVVGLLLLMLAGPSTGAVAASSVPRYDHIFVIVEENHGFADVIGNPAAPNLNALADRFGLATNYFGVTHPSEPNYVAVLGGSAFGIADDNPYFMNAVTRPSLISQLDRAGIRWKAYLQSSPHAGYTGICYPARCNGSPDVDPLYVSKHDGIQNFTTSLNTADWSRQVPIEQLDDDLASGDVPAFDYVIPDECYDEHGDPPYCLDSGNPGDAQDQHLVAQGDRYLGDLVSRITSARFWARGNNAIVVVYDEGDDNAGCCDAPSGGGQVAAVVVTSHGPRGVRDSTPYNHFSLLATIQQSFRLGCLAFTCDAANVAPLAPLFAVTGSAAVATQALPVPDFPTPSPTPVEPTSVTTNTDASGGWRVVKAQRRGTSDNSLGAVAGSGSDDVWAVGNFLPDTPASNQDATLSLAEHFDGQRWTVTPTPNAGPNFNTLFGAAAAGSRAWGVGVHLDASFHPRALVEAWDAGAWRLVDVPTPGALGDMLFSASATSPGDVWAVGHRQAADGRFATLVEHWDGQRWSVVPSPDPGSAGNSLYGVAAVGPRDVWAVGQRLDVDGPDDALIEHWDGRGWIVVPAPRQTASQAALYSVSADGERVWAVGETIDPQQGGRPLVEALADDGRWQTLQVAPTDSPWATLWGVSASDADDGVWSVGNAFNVAKGDFDVLVLRGERRAFQRVNAPNPGTGVDILAGVTRIGDRVWSVGHFDDSGRAPLIEEHTGVADDR
jgi:hypothetical protein